MTSLTVYKVLREMQYLDLDGTFKVGGFSANTPHSGAWEHGMNGEHDYIVHLPLRKFSYESRYENWKELRLYQKFLLERDGDAELHQLYTFGEWLTPPMKESKWFVFDTEKLAMDYAAQYASRIIVAVGEAEDIEVPPSHIPDITNDEDREAFWKNDRALRVNQVMTTPEGTLFAGRIKLERVIARFYRGYNDE